MNTSFVFVPVVARAPARILNEDDIPPSTTGLSDRFHTAAPNGCRKIPHGKAVQNRTSGSPILPRHCSGSTRSGLAMITSNARSAVLLTSLILIGSPGLCSAQSYRDDERHEVATIAASRMFEPRGASEQPMATAQVRQPESAASVGDASNGERSLLDEAGLRIDPTDAEVWWRAYKARQQ